MDSEDFPPLQPVDASAYPNPSCESSAASGLQDRRGYALLATAPDWIDSDPAWAAAAGGAPGQRWREHWQQCVAPVIGRRVEDGACVVSEGQPLRIAVTTDSDGLRLHCAAAVADADLRQSDSLPPPLPLHAGGWASGGAGSWARKWALREGRAQREAAYGEALAAALSRPWLPRAWAGGARDAEAGGEDDDGAIVIMGEGGDWSRQKQIGIHAGLGPAGGPPGRQLVGSGGQEANAAGRGRARRP